jgi:tRNA threonylcarbamoyladenosine biosynthesis protein TsaB
MKSVILPDIPWWRQQVTVTPKLLILETSGRSGSVAVALGSELRETRILDESRRHARDLAPTVAELLHTQGWRARDLDGVIVSRGPGSYTGLRVGIASAKTLAYATGCRLLTIDTFAVVASQAEPPIERVDVLGDAQQDKVYFQPFALHDLQWRATAELSVVRFADWLAARDPNAAVTGPGLVKWHAQLPSGTPHLPQGDWAPRAATLLHLGLGRLLAGERDDPWAVEPLYLRPSSAEEQWDRRK